MDKEKILKICDELKAENNHFNFHAKAAEIKNFISSVCGKSNSFYEAVDKVRIAAAFPMEQLNYIVDAFRRSIENELISNTSYERKLQTAVVNDFLLQAEDILQKVELHAAVAAFLIGASLEEFLRNWVVEQNLLHDIKKASINNYAMALKQNNLIDLQEYKEITAWTGIRNDAAHGNWNKVDNRDKLNLVLSGVTIFIKKHSL